MKQKKKKKTTLPKTKVYGNANWRKKNTFKNKI